MFVRTLIHLIFLFLIFAYTCCATYNDSNIVESPKPTTHVDAKAWKKAHLVQSSKNKEDLKKVVPFVQHTRNQDFISYRTNDLPVNDSATNSSELISEFTNQPPLAENEVKILIDDDKKFPQEDNSKSGYSIIVIDSDTDHSFDGKIIENVETTISTTRIPKSEVDSYKSHALIPYDFSKRYKNSAAFDIGIRPSHLWSSPRARGAHSPANHNNTNSKKAMKCFNCPEFYLKLRVQYLCREKKKVIKAVCSTALRGPFVLLYYVPDFVALLTWFVIYIKTQADCYNQKNEPEESCQELIVARHVVGNIAIIAFIFRFIYMFNKWLEGTWDNHDSNRF